MAIFITAGNPGCNDLDDEQELYYPAICRAVADLPYDGYFGQEFTPKSDVLSGLEAAFEVCEV